MSVREQGLERVIAGHRVVGTSVAGVETVLALPELGVCFDVGRCPPAAVRCRTVLLSHAHVDHLGGIVHHVSLRALQGAPPSRLLAPPGLAGALPDLFAWWSRTTWTELPCEIVAVRPGDAVEVGRGLTARALRASHRVETLAWMVERTTRRLLPAYRDLPGTEIAALRARGDTLDESVTVGEVAFTGDSRAAVLDREPALRTSRLLMGECTFLDEDGAAARAERTGHMCLADWASRSETLHNERVLLTHFSQRYPVARIQAAVATLPERLRGRVELWLPTPS